MQRKGRMTRRPLSPLARQRAARGLKQKTLAVLMRVQPSTVCAWETGRFRPEPERIPVLAQHLGVDPIVVAQLVDAAPMQDARM